MQKVNSRLALVEQFPLKTHCDDRGYLLKAVENSFARGHSFGEIYIVQSVPGCVRANHYHLQTTEWFVLIKGRGMLELVDPEYPQERISISLDHSKPVCVLIPPGVAHGILALGDAEMVMMAFADKRYDPSHNDTFPFEVIQTEFIG
jgi:dTDP-4-dehydrorhamnose 3,5-epimerase-like enzyme